MISAETTKKTRIVQHNWSTHKENCNSWLNKYWESQYTWHSEREFPWI